MALIVDLSLLIALFMYCTAFPLDDDTKQRDVTEFKLQPVIVKPQPPSTVVEREPYYSPYPLTKRFNTTAPRLIREYDRFQHVAVSLLDTLDGYNEERACAEVHKFIRQNVTHADTDQCIPRYSCDFDPARYPSTLIRVTCPRHSSCIDDTYSRGTCLSMYSYPVTVLQFIPREENRLEAGSGSEPLLAPLKIEGEWFYTTLTLASSCFCSDDK